MSLNLDELGTRGEDIESQLRRCRPGAATLDFRLLASHVEEIHDGDVRNRESIARARPAVSCAAALPDWLLRANVTTARERRSP